MLLLEQVLVAVARLDHGRHVDIVEGGQQRGGFLRLLEAAGDGLAQARHLHALGAALAGGGERRAIRRGGGGSGCIRPRLARLGGGQDVFLGQAPVLAGAAHRGRVDAMLQHRAAHRGREGERGVGGFRRCRGGGRGSGCRCGRGCRRRWRRLLHLPHFRRAGGRHVGLDQRDHRADFHRVADGRLVLAHDAGDGGRHFHRDLVGLEAGDGLVELHRIARLLEPFADGGFGDRFTESGDFDFAGHALSSLCGSGSGDQDFLAAAFPGAALPAAPDRPRASETRASCSILWRAAKPVAGEAEATRPA